MSAKAVAHLKQMWENLTFAKVDQVIAREPEDILSIQVRKTIETKKGTLLTWETAYEVPSKRTSDIPDSDREKALISWWRYYGFTDEGIYFHKDDYRELDLFTDMTFTWSTYYSSGNKPEVGSIIAGEVIDTPEGKRFSNWFVCTPQVKFLLDSVLQGTDLSEEEMASKLMSDGFYDKYWAIARLVFFDNVQAFVDQGKKIRPTHPCFGQEYGDREYIGKKPKVDWDGMSIPKDTATFVHMLSYHLEPMWWEQFWRLNAEAEIYLRVHPGPSPAYYCNACWAEEHPDRVVYC